MNIKDALAQSPQYIQDSPIVQAMVQLIQSQAKQIQRQTEQICKLEEVVDSLKDEISRLNKTPKRPKFKPNKMEPRDRGNNSFKDNLSKNDLDICTPEKNGKKSKYRQKEFLKEHVLKDILNLRYKISKSRSKKPLISSKCG